MSAPDLSAAAARRIALAAQGFADRQPRGKVTLDHVRRVLGRVGLFQIDSVNVLVRAHYLPLFARLGPYQASLLESLAYERRELFEYWGHEASLMPVEYEPLLRWRMDRASQGEAWGGLVTFARENRAYVEAAYQAVVDRGPLSAAGLGKRTAPAGPWWGWDERKHALEWLYWTGQIAIASRPNFERVYDLPERIYPPEILGTPTPPPEEAQRDLLRIAARCLGIATVTDLADYFRIRMPLARPRIAELVEAGDIVPVRVEGWPAQAYLDPAAAIPRSVRARALVSPFDSLVWERSRTDRLFGFHLRIEIYTPAPKRQFGYYVLPFLLGDRLVGRVDLKSDRKQRALLVQGAFAEAGQRPEAVAEQMVPELERMATWLGLERVAVGERGEVAAPLRAIIGSDAVMSTPATDLEELA